MIYGLYLSAQGAASQSRRLEVIANNLANAGTGAFKRDLAIFQDHRPYDADFGNAQNLPNGLGHSTGGVALAEVATDFSAGPVVQTGATYDLALVGEGYLRVSSGQSELLTRNGRLTVNEFGELATTDGGHRVLSSGGGLISIPDDSRNVEITTGGAIFSVGPDGSRTLAGQLDLVRPRSPGSLQKVGNSMFRAQGRLETAVGNVSVQQGYLELSGTQSTVEMMHMIEASRAYETNVNMMKFQDEALGNLLGSLMRS